MVTDEESGRERLRRKLAKLAGLSEPATASGRELRVGDAEGLIGSLLTEIDETLLARRLTFRTMPGAPALRLEVYGRRLIRVLAPAPVGLPPEAAALAGKPLVEDDIDALGDLLVSWIGSADRVAVRAEPPPEDRDPLMLGIAAETLAEAWGLELDTGPLLTPSAALDALATLPALAWLRDGPEGRTEAGDPAAVARLAGADTGALATPPRSDGKQVPPRCILLGQSDQGQALVFAEAGGETLLMLFAETELGTAARVWRSLIR